MTIFEFLLFTFEYSNTYMCVCMCVGTIENIPFHITKVTPYRFSTLSPSPLYYPSYLSYKYYAALSLLCTCDPSFSC